MKVENSAGGGATIALEGREVEVMRLALERASFIDTPPDRQDEILHFAEELLNALAPPSRKPGS